MFRLLSLGISEYIALERSMMVALCNHLEMSVRHLSETDGDALSSLAMTRADAKVGTLPKPVVAKLRHADAT